MNVYLICIVFFAILFALLSTVVARPKFSFAERPAVPGYNAYSFQKVPNGDTDPSPEAKHMHRAKRLQRKIRRLCLQSGGKNGRSVSPEGKFFFPTIVQQTGVDVDVGPGYDDYDDHEHESGAAAAAGAGSGLRCVDLLNAGFFNNLHPFPQVLPGGGGGDDEDSESKFYHKNFNRHVIRPLYRSMRKFYRLLTR